MADRPQGPGWWQASDLKWYPPEKRSDHVARSSPPATQSSVTLTSKSGAHKVWFTLAGTALLLVIATLVAGRVLLGNFLPGLLLVATLATIGTTVVIRSGQPVPRKAMIVTAIVIVVAVAVPASLKVVYPVYHHFFSAGTSQASPSSGSAAPAPNAGVPSSTPYCPPGTTYGPDPDHPQITACHLPPAPASAYKFTLLLNGTDIVRAAPANSSLATSVGCNPILTTAHAWDGTFTIAAGMSTNQVSANFELNSSNQPLSGVITTSTGLFGFVPGQYGDAQVGASGSSVTEAKVTGTYRITGHVLPVTVVNSWTNAQAPKPGAPASSFEFDGTCQ